MRALLSSIVLITAVVGLASATRASDTSKDWRKYNEAMIYKEEEMFPPSYLDYNSTLLTSDGYIVFKEINPLPSFETRNGKLYKNTQNRNFNADFSYSAINCTLKRFASSANLPKFSSTWWDYTKDDGVYNVEMARNVERLLCGKTGIRSIPHKVGEVLYLNKKKNVFKSSPTMDYDEAVLLGILK